MKGLLLIGCTAASWAVVIAAGLGLVGCGADQTGTVRGQEAAATNAAAPAPRTENLELVAQDWHAGGVYVFHDANGCEYLLIASGGVTPRLGPDGLQTGCRRGG